MPAWSRSFFRSHVWTSPGLTVGVTIVLMVASLAIARFQQVTIAEATLHETAISAARAEAQTFNAFDRYYSEVVMPRAKAAGMKLTYDHTKHPGDLPFPATFIKDVGAALNEVNGEQSFRVVSNYPWPFQEGGGPVDEFEKRALEVLASGENDEYSELVKTGDGSQLRYASAMRMESGCLVCHNEMVESPKRDWKVGEVRGAGSLTLMLPPAPGFFSTEYLHTQALGLVLMIALLVAPCVTFLIRQARAREAMALERLRYERDKAVAANEAKDSFMANMSHELRTPLNAIIGFAQMIQLGRQSISRERCEEYANDILNSGQNLLVLIDDLLELEKIENGMLVLEESEFNLPDLLDASVRRLSSIATQKQVTISLECKHETARLLGDPHLLARVSDNLLSNAVKFSYTGGLVSVGLDCTVDGNMRIVYRDQGIGMTAEAIRQVFQPYVQANASITRTHGGTGLGLAIVQQLVEAHGGSVSLTSSPGAGTTVSVILPANRIRGMLQQVA